MATLALSANFEPPDDRERGPYAGDFLHEWTGAYIVRSGDVGRLYDPAYAKALQHDASLVGFRLRSDGFLPLVYPPVYYLALSPLAALPYRTAAWVWVALTLVCFAGTIGILAMTLGRAGALGGRLPAPDVEAARLRRLGALVALPAAVTFLPFAENLVGGQKGTLILLVLTATWAALQRGNELAAGLVFGVLAVKPQLAFVIPVALLAKGAWRFAAGVAITAATLVLASTATGVDLVRDYVRLVQTLPEQIRFAPGQLHRIHGVYGFFTVLAGGATAPVRAATLVTASLVVVLLARLLRGPLELPSPRFAIQYAGLVVATVLLAPNVVTYDLTILLLPLFLLGWLLARGAILPARRPALPWLLAGAYVACAIGPAIAARTGVQLTMPMLLVLLGWLSVPRLLGESVRVPVPGGRPSEAGWPSAEGARPLEAPPPP